MWGVRRRHVALLEFPSPNTTNKHGRSESYEDELTHPWSTRRRAGRGWAGGRWGWARWWRAGGRRTRRYWWPTSVPRRRVRRVPRGRRAGRRWARRRARRRRARGRGGGGTGAVPHARAWHRTTEETATVPYCQSIKAAAAAATPGRGCQDASAKLTLRTGWWRLAPRRRPPASVSWFAHPYLACGPRLQSASEAAAGEGGGKGKGWADG